MFNLLYVTPRSTFLKTLIVGYFDRKKEDFKDILDRFFSDKLHLFCEEVTTFKGVRPQEDF